LGVFGGQVTEPKPARPINEPTLVSLKATQPNPRPYPHEDLGGTEFVHRWGPHVSALRSWTVARFIQLWAEADLHSAPYQPQQLMLFLGVEVGVRF
jgi:hypothetical protein